VGDNFLVRKNRHSKIGRGGTSPLHGDIRLIKEKSSQNEFVMGWDHRGQGKRGGGARSGPGNMERRDWKGQQSEQDQPPKGMAYFFKRGGADGLKLNLMVGTFTPKLTVNLGPKKGVTLRVLGLFH